MAVLRGAIQLFFTKSLLAHIMSVGIMNRVSLIGAEVLDESAQFALNEATLTAQSLLSAIASDADFLTKVTLAFGDGFNAENLEGLRQQWAASDFGAIPAIEIRSSSEINGANAAFSADTNTIYLSREYIAQNSSNPQAIAGTTATTTLTIEANDLIAYTISAGAASIAEGNSGSTPVSFTVSRSGGTDAASSIDYVIGGTAINDNDYNNIGGTSGAESTTGTINFAAGETSKTITMNVVGDTEIEANEEITLTLSNPVATGLTPTITTQTATTTIVNDDFPVVNFGASSYSSTEDSSDTIINIPVTLSETPLSDVSVAIAIDPSSTATLGASNDYTLSATTLTFNAGATGEALTQNVALTIKPDNIAENAETVILNLGTITGAKAGTTTATTLTIEANDPIAYEITADTASITEGNSGSTPISFTVSRSGGTDAASSIDYAIGATASNDLDYNNIRIGETSGATGITGTLDFAAGETSKTITMDVVGDTEIEANEEITLTLSNPVATGFTPTITTQTATTTIVNDDFPVVNFGASSYSSTEDSSDTIINIPVTLSETPLTDVTVAIAINNSSSATQNADYTLPTTTGNHRRSAPSFSYGGVAAARFIRLL